MSSRKEVLDAYHARGQKDAAKGEFDLPHSSAADDLAGLFSSTEANRRVTEDQQAYRDGQDNHEEQAGDE